MNDDGDSFNDEHEAALPSESDSADADAAVDVDAYNKRTQQLISLGQQSTQAGWDAILSDNDDDELDKKSEYYDNMSIAGDTPSISEKKKLERDELEYSDEVDLDPDTQCRVRFARYRGLKSFQQSPWDPMESLPLEYSQIYRFANFQATRRRVMNSATNSDQNDDDISSNGVQPDQLNAITLHVVNVPTSTAQQSMRQQTPCVVFSLYEYEHKISVVHFLIKRHNEYTDPIKAKQPLEFQCGFRRFTARPIYSKHDNGDKHLTSRFLHESTFTVASIYGRITFPPATVLIFLPSNNTNDATVHPRVDRPLVASGTLLSVDPNRMLIKRIVLTGHVVDSHKRSAVVRHMFFNAADIAWFKPIELWTKHGMVGHIKESRGTKGYMKCIFDGHIKQHDTVCMSLYKRQYPKLHPQLL
jgi:pre-rRNA-processing protein TSR1